MSDELTTTVSLPVRVRARDGVGRPLLRVRHGIRHPGNWLQFVRFDYRVSAVIAWAVSVLNNFWWNRHWTFDARQDRPVLQAVRFFAVSLVAFGFTYVVLVALVDAGAMKVLAQAIAIVAGMPLSFIGQKLWSFRA
jgi:dolichol-phosphate mannosyltransferase